MVDLNEETKEPENKDVNKGDEGLLTAAVLGTTPLPTLESGAVGGSSIVGDAEKNPKVPNESEIIKTTKTDHAAIKNN